MSQLPEPPSHCATTSETRPTSQNSDLRLAQPSDQPSIEEIVRLAYSPYISRIGRLPGPMLDDYGTLITASRVHVVERDGAIQGFVVLVPEETVMLLDNVAVAPSAQGTGLGRRLIHFAEETAQEKGFGAIRLYTNEAMIENVAYYSRIGYVETHRGEEKGLKRVYMVKILL